MNTKLVCKRVRIQNVGRSIREVKEYRRHDTLSEGMTVVSDTIRIRSVAVEPQVKDALPWLDVDSRDDRIIASFI